MAGLLSARILSEHFEKVILLERDQRPDGPLPRKGIPQGQHVHALLDTGRQLLEELFPGMLQELQAEGVEIIDSGRDFAWHHFDVWKTRYTSGITVLLSSRVFLEWSVFRRVAALPNVELREQCSVEALLTDTDQRRVTGVRVKSPSGEESLEAALVVDASGRGSRAPQWLEALGYGRPAEEKIELDLAYTSCFFERPANFQGEWNLLVQHPRPPRTWRAGFISNVEGGRWLVSLNGYFGAHAPANMEGFLEFARSLSQPTLYTYIKDAKPLSPFTTHKVMNTRWLHYEDMPRFPEGFTIVGDAVCALNPVFGQGMTIAGLGANLLGQCLREQAQRSPASLDGLSRRFQQRLPEIIRLPWFLTCTLDLQYPQAVGRRMPGLGLLHWYIGRLLERSSLSTAVYHQLTRILHLQAGMGAILQPSVALAVLAHAIQALFVPLQNRANTDTLPPPPEARPPLTRRGTAP
jgi:2-polyprenyl-6-methoxyphenol hydroxylase-like FAD-dependent oxidoreductase